MSLMFRARVVRADGRAINVGQRRAHLSYCFTGCCCGRTERGYAAVPVDTFKEEWLRRKLPAAAPTAGECPCGSPSRVAVRAPVMAGRPARQPGPLQAAADYRMAIRVAPPDRALEYLPTGGRTPLAHGLELAAGYVTDDAIVVVITDGRANVPTRSEDAWADACATARGLGSPAIVIDTEDPRTATGRPRELAAALAATYSTLDAFDASGVLRVFREPA